MNGKQTWVTGAAIIIGCLILGLFLGRPSAAQKTPKQSIHRGPKPVGGSQPKDGQQATGRYRAVLATGRAGDRVLVVDTVTGRCWFKLTEGRTWKDLGSPVQ
jgi:hypothetical protein